MTPESIPAKSTSAPCPPTSEIVLVRHGRSAHVADTWLNAAGLRAWMVAYDAAGIASSSRPTQALLAVAAGAARVLSSDLPRATASAALLAETRKVDCTPLLREVPLESAAHPLPSFGGMRLPLRAWAFVFGLRWARAALAGSFGPGVDADVIRRVESAVEWVLARTAAGERVLVVTHGTMRRLLAAELLRRGWTSVVGRSVRPWSAWTFRLAVAAARKSIQIP